MPKILIVGDTLSERDTETGVPFSDGAGSILHGILRQAGVPKEDVTFTTVIPERIRIDDILTDVPAEAVPGWPTYAPRLSLHSRYALALADFTALRTGLAPDVIVALGDLALWALTHQRGFAKYRGTVLPTFDGLHKVIPTWHPTTIIKQWDLRVIALLDIQKALRQSAFPEIRRPQRNVRLAPTLADIESFYHEHIVLAPLLGVDIETKANQITEIGFAASPSEALVIPFWSRGTCDGNYWPTKAEELRAWQWVRRILAEKRYVGQNFQYDMTYLYKRMGIPSPGFAGDTMLLHHAMQPELKKSLGFLGSIYTDEPSWKFMREGADTLKKED